ncbi:MAG: methyltransferase [Boseongicola sp.]|nr:MAG: methyltransferase [Boseongicola sp.]
MSTWTALTTLAGKAAAETLGEALEALEPAPTGVGVFEIEDGQDRWEVGGYFLESPDEVALALLAAVHGAASFAVSEVPDRDWVAHVRRELQPVEAGRFFVYGAHDADKVPGDRHALLIEAAMAFGTGHHGTTLGCLMALNRLLDQGVHARSVVDVGCGTAVLAMAAASVWPEKVLASDIDPVAVEVAETNLRANGLEDRVRCVEATGFDHPDLSGAGAFDLIFANILKGPLLAMAEDLAESLAVGGHAILSGILNEQAAEVVSEYARFGLNAVHSEEIVDWTTLTLRKSA